MRRDVSIELTRGTPEDKLASRLGGTRAERAYYSTDSRAVRPYQDSERFSRYALRITLNALHSPFRGQGGL